MTRFITILLLHLLLYMALPLSCANPPRCDLGEVISTVDSILKAEVLYQITRGRGRFTDLVHLSELGLIDSAVARDQKYGYVFRVELAGPSGSMFDVVAFPVSAVGTCPRPKAFYANETMVVYEADGGEPPAASVRDRRTESGRPLRDDFSKLR